jgi:carbon monoxide dehydrogenase subunit G
MKMNGEQLIGAPRQRVWDALNDPDVLRQCIPGCQSLEKESDERMKATVAIKVGPIGARFNGDVTLSELDPPNGYVITGEGQGGTAGFAKGGARISLTDENGGTRLTYVVDADVSGRLAQLGGVIIDATAKQLAGVFFKRFGEIVAASSEPGQPLAAGAEASPPTTTTAAALSAAAPGLSAPGAYQAVPFPSLVVERSPAAFYWIVTVFLGALVGFLLGGGDRHGGQPLFSLIVGITIAALAVLSFECGRRAKPARPEKGQ